MSNDEKEKNLLRGVVARWRDVGWRPIGGVVAIGKLTRLLDVSRSLEVEGVLAKGEKVCCGHSASE